MSFVCTLLRNVLSDREDYCCLCFTSIGEMDTSYNIKDEVTINNDNMSTVKLNEILHNVVGNEVLYSISTNILCQKCTEIVLKSYKFIQQCRDNIHKLHCVIDSLQTKDINVETKDVKSLFIAVDANNDIDIIDLYYDKNRNDHNQDVLLKRFHDIQREYHYYSIEIELELNDGAKKTCPVKTKNHEKVMDSLGLADIVHDKNDLNNFQCKICMKLFNTAQKLRLHYIRVHAPKKYKCSQCPRSFATLLLLKQHSEVSHCSVICSQCGKSYTNINSLRHHERSHNLQLICQTCGKVYKGKQAFNNHIDMNLCTKMRKSNAEAEFVCDYCGKKYAQKTALRVHICVEHQEGKALVCDWCGKKFSSMSKLKAHSIKHTKQKNFECQLCGRRFVSKTSLLYHTRTHTGEKPYKCEHCDMAFLSASRRSEHVKQFHSATNFECDICHTKLKGHISLRRHRKRHFDIRSRLYRQNIFINQCV